MKRFREWIESIVFAGLKPSGAPVEHKQRKWLGPLAAPIDKFLSGGPAPTDPLYLTNRTMGQKLKSWSLVGVPLLVLMAGIGIALSTILTPPAGTREKEPTPAEVASKILPNMDKDLQIASNKELELAEIHVQKTGDGAKLIGVIRNRSNRVLGAEIIFDLTDSGGSQVGSVSSFVEKVPAGQTKPFETPVKQGGTAFALVREIITRTE
jgi:hypothetical protein